MIFVNESLTIIIKIDYTDLSYHGFALALATLHESHISISAPTWSKVSYFWHILFPTLKIACSVRRWRSVKTKRGFLGAEAGGSGSKASFLLHAEKWKKILKHEGSFIFYCHESRLNIGLI